MAARFSFGARPQKRDSCLFLPPAQVPQRRPGLGADGAADAEAEPPRHRPHAALVRTVDSHSPPVCRDRLIDCVIETRRGVEPV